MTIQASGAVSLRDVNFELAKANASIANTTTITMNDTRVRALTGNTTNASIEKFSYFYGKSAITIGFVSVSGLHASTSGTGVRSATCTLNTDGTVTITATGSATVNGSWASPTTTGIGSSYYGKFVLTSFTDSAGDGSATANTAVTQLSSNLAVDVTAPAFTGTVDGGYNIFIYSDSAGTNQLATTSITLEARHS